MTLTHSLTYPDQSHILPSTEALHLCEEGLKEHLSTNTNTNTNITITTTITITSTITITTIIITSCIIVLMFI